MLPSLCRNRRWVACGTIVVLAAIGLTAPVAAQEGPFPQQVTLTPESDSARSGTCNEFTARVTGFAEESGSSPVEGVTVDVLQSLSSAGVEPGETRELSFCDPVDPSGPNPTGGGSASFGDVGGNNAGEAVGQPGRNTSVHGEVGPTGANGQVTFGISMTPATSAATVQVRVWFETGDDDSWLEGDEPSDLSTKTWTAQAGPAVTVLDATPEAATNDNGTQHQVTVTMTSDGQPVEGVVPASAIVADGTGRPAGDVADSGSGPSPNFVPGRGKPSVYSCTASNASGASTCTFTDPQGTGAGTDTIVFFVDRGGEVAEPDDDEPQDAVQKTWVVPAGPPGNPGNPPAPPPQARNVRLCHDTATTTSCDTSQWLTQTGDERIVAALVTNRSGAPLSGIPVQLRETGPAFFTATGSGSVVVVTDANGVARGTLTSDLEGTSTVVAEISPLGLAGGFRGPGPSDDECEQPAGPDGSPPAGNCISSAVSIMWIDAPTPPNICDDGLDNDGDELIDFPEDPGCEGPDDEDESPANTPPGPDKRHQRRVSMRFRDWVGPTDEGLVIFGRLRLIAGADGLHACVVRQAVKIQRWMDGEWVTKKTATTNGTGRYAGVVLDFTGRYRAVAVRSEILYEAGGHHVCMRATKDKTHHHRR